MILKTIILQPDMIASMCAVCVSDRSGGQIALLIIVASLIFLGIANWAWKKYSKSTQEFSSEK